MINNVVIVGRLTKDVEAQKTQNGLSISNFIIACNRGKDQPANFIRCTAWRQAADFIGQYGKKGDIWAVRGHIETNSYEKQGVKCYSQDIIADEVKAIQVTKQEDNLGVGNDEFYNFNF